MDKVKCNVFAKGAAIILSFFTILLTVVSVTGVGTMAYLDFYTRQKSLLKTDIMQDYISSEPYNAFYHWRSEESLENYYKDKNIYVTITDQSGNVLFNNYNSQMIIAEVISGINANVYVDQYGKTYMEPFVYSEYYDGFTTYYNTYDEEVLFSHKETFSVTVAVPEKMEFTDRYFLVASLIDIGYNLRYSAIFIAIFSLIASVVLVIFMFSSAGHRAGAEGITLNMIDKLPGDVYASVIALISLVIIAALVNLSYNIATCLVSLVLLIPLLYWLVLAFLLSAATRIKCGTIFKNTVIWRVFAFIGRSVRRVLRLLKYIFGNISSVWKTALILAAVFFAEFIIICVSWYETDNLLIWWIIKSILFAVLLMLAAIGFQKIKQGAERIADGDLDSKIETKYLIDDLASFGDTLNNIKGGMQKSLADKMKSERLKTELITNVSHDLKTPLTSIVNYVDLIKKQDCENDTVKEYVDVLDRQSNRLKKLVEDLVEASKASTGNLSVEFGPCDVAVLLNQAVAEYEENLRAKNLQIVLNAGDGIIISADGRRLWRVFDNLLNNICKYAMPETRVYIELVQENGKTVISFKNISADALNINGEELTERFVRGDRSRNTEGSGLGLSIARSLTELQGGSFEINIDGDLFKAIIIFNS